MSKNPSTDSAKDRRQKAAEARAAQEAAEKRRDRTIKIIGAIAVVVVVGAIIGGAVWQSRSSSSTSASSTLPSPDPSAALPKGVVATGDNAFAVPVGTPKAGAPVLQVWEDFQCPICGATEAANGAGIQALASSGAAQLYYRPVAFLDRNLASQNISAGTTNSSHRAIAAWGCAIDAGKGLEYHNIIYANQPSNEGGGYTTAQLLDFGKQAGITGDAYTTFEKCVNDNTYLGWAVNADNEMSSHGISGTPTGILNGTELPQGTLSDKAALDAAVAAAAKK